ncbi:hypothetical protein [Tumebacillus avium]|uniref:hypothetical protein n=1 Tax=Tumebacillus avium TaxID=1903704 RepID=UPI000B3B3645|nr:hypothetical protein [Tumebacillus avium]
MEIIFFIVIIGVAVLLSGLKGGGKSSYKKSSGYNFHTPDSDSSDTDNGGWFDFGGGDSGGGDGGGGGGGGD